VAAVPTDPVSRGRLAIHGHFYQPARIDPFSGLMPPEPGAAPYHDWNARIDAECYRPNAERGNLARISFDIGPTLAGWMERESRATLSGFVGADRAGGRPGAAIAQAFHHSILPLASAADRLTEISWGLADFERRFGRPALGIWLPETAVDLPTLRAVAGAGIRYTILAPWQAAEQDLDTRRPYRVDLGGRASLVAVFYDARLSAAVSFDPAATADADRFAREAIAPRLATAPLSASPLAVIATDGELYGHHLKFRDLFLQRLVAPAPDVPDRGFDIVDLATAVLATDVRALAPVKIVERTSWSCHHGVARWTHECPDAPDGRWKGPLRAAFERLAGGIDAITEAEFRRLPGGPDPWAARDAYVAVVLGAQSEAAFASGWLPATAPDGAAARFLGLLAAQRWRLAMFASDGWFWEDPARIETKQVLRCAARAARLVDGLVGSRLEERLVADLSLLVSPSLGITGTEIYRLALAEVGQPARV
jgi:hypothetical protein